MSYKNETTQGTFRDMDESQIYDVEWERQIAQEYCIYIVIVIPLIYGSKTSKT